MGVRRGGRKGGVVPSKWFFINVFYLGERGACLQINPCPRPLMEILYEPLNEGRYEKIVESSDTQIRLSMQNTVNIGKISERDTNVNNVGEWHVVENKFFNWDGPKVALSKGLLY